MHTGSSRLELPVRPPRPDDDARLPELGEPEGFRRGEWAVTTVTHTRITCTPEDFVVHARLDAYEGHVRIHSANWRRRVARDHV